MIGSLHRYALTVSFLCCRMSTMAAKFPAIRHVISNHASVTYLNAAQAKRVDDRLMTAPGFSIDQLMELAGLSVANSIVNYMEIDKLRGKDCAKIAVFCGPGNNGGDGLVAARHLKHFGYSPTVIYPKQGKTPLFVNLVQQMVDLDIPVSEHAPGQTEYESYALAVDALFGFSFQGPTRQPYTDIINTFASSKIPVVSVDIPSGWEVDTGDIHHTNFVPKAVVSLTAPKLCMRNYTGLHFVGGRFVPPKVAEELGVTLPDYGTSTDQHGILSYGTSATPPAGADNVEPVNVMFVTASSAEEARRLSQELLRRKLVACVNIVPGIESHYEWEGRLETSQEVLLMIKTRKALVDSVTAAVEELHSYSVPESLALEVTAGSGAYLDWVRASTRAPVSMGTKDGQGGAASSGVSDGAVSAEASCTAKDVLANTEQGTTDACST